MRGFTKKKKERDKHRQRFYRVFFKSEVKDIDFLFTAYSQIFLETCRYDIGNGRPDAPCVLLLISCFYRLIFFFLLSAALSNDSFKNNVSIQYILLQVSKDCVLFTTTTTNRSVVVFVPLSVMYSPLIVFFPGSVSSPLPLCFALLCHLSLLRLLLCVSCQVLDIIYDLVLCPDCETPDKTSISATNTQSVGLFLHSTTPFFLSLCGCANVGT